ncbi:MAG: alpha-glucosidase C-terminal domain-containing protein, partial [Bacteroidales bacterium]|nr:alpha-glucosidase C-terminal domain-containing protein [Bacteroidales bacterium]
SEEDRKYIHDNYCHKPEWDFRLGEGISARLSELMQFDYEKELLAYSVMLTLPGTPIIYYGDEFGKANDYDYYKEQVKFTGKDDTRFLVRGKIDWKNTEQQLSNSKSFNNKLFNGLKEMLNRRNQLDVFGTGTIEWVNTNNNAILSYYRTSNGRKVLIINNLSDKEQNIDIENVGNISLSRYAFQWIII